MARADCKHLLLSQRVLRPTIAPRILHSTSTSTWIQYICEVLSHWLLVVHMRSVAKWLPMARCICFDAIWRIATMPGYEYPMLAAAGQSSGHCAVGHISNHLQGETYWFEFSPSGGQTNAITKTNFQLHLLFINPGLSPYNRSKGDILPKALTFIS